MRVGSNTTQTLLVAQACSQYFQRTVPVVPRLPHNLLEDTDISISFVLKCEASSVSLQVTVAYNNHIAASRSTPTILTRDQAVVDLAKQTTDPTLAYITIADAQNARGYGSQLVKQTIMDTLDDLVESIRNAA